MDAMLSGKVSATKHVGTTLNTLYYTFGITDNVSLATTFANSYPHCIAPFMKLDVSVFASLQKTPGALYTEEEDQIALLNPEIFSLGQNKRGECILTVDTEKLLTQKVERQLEFRGEIIRINTTVGHLAVITTGITGCPFDQFMNRIFPKLV